MHLSKQQIDDIPEFLNVAGKEAARRGREYFTSGRVISIECLEPNLYTAVVRGSKDYGVQLEFTLDGWAGECSCPLLFDCKHVVAALLALQHGAPVNEVKPAEAKRRNVRTVGEAQKPSSPLEARLCETLGRKLLPEEARFVGHVRELYNFARFRLLTESDIHLLVQRQPAYGSYIDWQELHLWRNFPRDDFSFWLYVAWELRRRNVAPPAFMQPITDFAPIENEMRDWEHEKDIARWKKWFEDFDLQSPASEPGLLELRLVILPAEARLQWRIHADAPFADLKQAQARKLGEQFSSGALAMGPESLPLWTATYRPWDYVSWWALKYADASARPALNRVLRMPLAPDRVVTADGQPLARPVEPLRLNLGAVQDAPDRYELALVTADGSLPPPILCVLEGRPTLYLTERSLFQGPPPNVLEKDSRRTIPSVALETSDGVRFLHALGLPLPDHLQKRVRVVPVNVAISCKVRTPYQGSSSEDIVFEVSAKAPGIEVERFTPRGWEQKNGKPREKPDRADRTITVHDRAAQRYFPRLLELLGLKWDGYPGEWRLRLTKKTPEIFVPWIKSLPPEIELLLDQQLATLRDEPISGSVSLDVTEAGIDWFDLKVVLDVGDATLTPEELKLLLNARGGYVRLGKKGWRRLHFNLKPEEDEQLARLGLNPRDFSAEPQRLHALQLADDAAKKFLPAEQVQQVQRRASELKTRVTPPLPPCIRAEMRPYQSDGFHFLAYLTANRFGGVLADDMGLGKTLQTLAWLAWLRESAGSALPSLVVCPKSVMDNWRAEAERFYPDLPVRMWRGEPASELSAAREAAGLIVINYAQLRSLWPPIASFQWFAAILDEAQYIKNPDSQTAQAARALNAEHRLALTGTPIENRLLDLWSIFGFAMPGVLGNRAHFLRRFDAKDDPLARRRLAARVRPFLLRRTKTQVAKDLPDRVEEDLLCEMEGPQQTLYRAELKRAQQLLLRLKTNQQLNKERFNILTSLLRLRQICCHPALVDAQLRTAESAKLAALEDLLEPLMEEGHKVLVFSQFVTMLDLLQTRIEQRGWPFFYLAGDTENRGELVQQFQTAKGAAVFLISLKAGGFGLNLTAASYVVLFDPWWNPAVEAQAIDRTHRIGQTTKVIAYRLLTRDSIEQKIRALQKEKAALAQDVLGEERFAQSLTLDDLQFLFAD